MSDSADAPEPTDPSITPALSGRSCLTVVLGLCLVVAGIFAVVLLDEQRRSARIANAETKYGATHVKRIRNGEGDALWRLLDGTIETCRISGEREDPDLRCGSDMDEPTVLDEGPFVILSLPHTSRA